MEQETVIFRDLGNMEYGKAWEYQEMLMKENIRIKASQRALAELGPGESSEALPSSTTHYFLMVEHPPVYTLGKSGKMENVLIDEEERREKGIGFFHTNRGGDITFHGPEQIVGYPILDLERLYTDIGRYLRELEEVIIRTLGDYGISAGRSAAETGVWMDPGIKGSERKICAMGVRCSRWITMHGFAFNINTNLDYFNHIIPCGIQDKKVTSLEKELGHPVPMEEVKEKLKIHFSSVFGVQLIGQNSFDK